MFQHLLREETILIGMEAENPAHAFEQIIDKIPTWNLDSQQKKNLLRALLERESFGTTAIGDGLALPHSVHAGVSFPLAALAISKQGIAFPSLDGEPVHLIFMVILPELEDSNQLKNRILHDAAILLRDRFLSQRLRLAETVEEAYEIILREANHNLPTLWMHHGAQSAK